MPKINITNLVDGEKSYDFIISPKDADIDFVEMLSDIFVNVKLYKSKSQISINAEIKGKIKFQCDRCLDDYAFDLRNSFDVIYKYVYGSTEPDGGNDDIRFISPNTRYIDLKEDIRDYILLSVPMRKIPVETEGICSYCNRDTLQLLNIKRQEEINPVWEKLIKAKTK